MADNSVIKKICLVNIPAAFVTQFKLNKEKIGANFLAVETCARHLYVGNQADLDATFPANLLKDAKSITLKQELSDRNSYMNDFVRIEKGEKGYSLFLRFLSGIDGPRVSEYHSKSQVKTSYVDAKDNMAGDKVRNFFENVFNFAFEDAKALHTLLEKYKINISGSKAVVAKSKLGKDNFTNILYISSGDTDKDTEVFKSLSYVTKTFHTYFENPPINSENQSIIDVIKNINNDRNLQVQSSKLHDLKKSLTDNKITSIIVSEGELSDSTRDVILNHLRKNPSIHLIDFKDEGRFKALGAKAIDNHDLTEFKKTAGRSNNELMDVLRKLSEDIAKYRIKGLNPSGKESKILKATDETAQKIVNKYKTIKR